MDHRNSSRIAKLQFCIDINYVSGHYAHIYSHFEAICIVYFLGSRSKPEKPVENQTHIGRTCSNLKLYIVNFLFCPSANVLVGSYWEVICGHTLALACGCRFE